MSTISWAASAATSTPTATPSAGGLSASTRTTAGPSENQESPSAFSSRDGRRVPCATSTERPMSRAAATTSGTSAGGITNSAGTNASWSGIV